MRKIPQNVPYIGITDFTSPDQVHRVLRVPTDRVLDTKMDHILGVGVMMSHKTLRGLPTKWAAAFPPKESVADIFIDDWGVFNVLHYADYEDVTTPDDLREVIALGGPNLDAIQLDMIWPRVDLIRAGFGSHNRPKIILQVGAKAMDAKDCDPGRIVQSLWEYHLANCLDYVLLDRSMGKGMGMNANLLLTLYRAIREVFSQKQLQVVVAGGLGPTTMSLLQPFREARVWDISIDAQGKLRPSGNALDPVDWTMAEEYYAQACGFFGLDIY